MGRLKLVISFLIVLTALCWTTSVLIYNKFAPQNISTLIIAFTLGLRHGVDADHIAAIDIVTMRLQTKLVGFYFSVGHCVVVLVATSIIAILSVVVDLKVTEVLGPIISATFLVVFAALSVYNLIRRQADDYTPPKIVKLIDKEWKMVMVGFLFGLGFDTSTEIALLSLAVIQASNVQGIVIFLALLFSNGMIIIDTINGMIMLKLYQTRFKLYLSIVSCLFAISIAVVQVLSIFYEFDDYVATGSSLGGSLILSVIIYYLLPQPEPQSTAQQDIEVGIVESKDDTKE